MDKMNDCCEPSHGPHVVRWFGHGFHAYKGCCHPQSKETKVKQLEAMKSQLKDSIEHIEKRIAEIEKEEEA